jgi:DNA-directed RNA polymerase specialized sigma24 family protein
MSSDSDRGLTADAFEVLLRSLDPDRDHAGTLYEELRERMEGLLRWWGSSNPADLADRTLDRVARKLAEGAQIRPGSFGAYVRSVARMIFYESHRERIEPLGDQELPLPETEESMEASLRCLDRCLDTLPKPDRRLVLRYYDSGAEERRRIAGELQISMVALRLRTLRLRGRLEGCVTACLEAR